MKVEAVDTMRAPVGKPWAKKITSHPHLTPFHEV